MIFSHLLKSFERLKRHGYVNTAGWHILWASGLSVKPDVLKNNTWIFIKKHSIHFLLQTSNNFKFHFYLIHTAITWHSNQYSCIKQLGLFTCRILCISSHSCCQNQKVKHLFLSNGVTLNVSLKILKVKWNSF